MQSPTTAPPIESGSAERIVIGWNTRANSSTSTANTMRTPVAIAMREIREQLAHDLRVADLDDGARPAADS